MTVTRVNTAMAARRTAAALRIQPALQRTTEISQSAATLVSMLLLSPGAMMAFVFGLWRLGQDLGWTGNFLISEGLFSHWQVWLAISVAIQFLAVLLNRYGTPETVVREAETTDKKARAEDESLAVVGPRRR